MIAVRGIKEYAMYRQDKIVTPHIEND